jgi:DNA-directed RNA polymerase specialized sigma24 family protein
MPKGDETRSDRTSYIAARVDGSNFWEVIMSSPFAIVDEPFSMDIREAVWDSIQDLDDKDRFVIEAVYIWGSSYSKLAKDLGYASKASAHGAVKTAEKHLRDILLTKPEVRKLLGEDDANMG